MEALRVERDGHVLRVTLARPERRNAFDAALIAELTTAFADVDDARAVVLAGDGPSFCAGADIEWQRSSIDLSYDENVEDAMRLYRMLEAIDSCPAPVVCLVHGHAFGGGSGSSRARTSRSRTPTPSSPSRKYASGSSRRSSLRSSCPSSGRPRGDTSSPESGSALTSRCASGWCTRLRRSAGSGLERRRRAPGGRPRGRARGEEAPRSEPAGRPGGSRDRGCAPRERRGPGRSQGLPREAAAVLAVGSRRGCLALCVPGEDDRRRGALDGPWYTASTFVPSGSSTKAA